MGWITEAGMCKQKRKEKNSFQKKKRIKIILRTFALLLVAFFFLVYMKRKKCILYVHMYVGIITRQRQIHTFGYRSSRSRSSSSSISISIRRVTDNNNSLNKNASLNHSLNVVECIKIFTTNALRKLYRFYIKVLG